MKLSIGTCSNFDLYKSGRKNRLISDIGDFHCIMLQQLSMRSFQLKSFLCLNESKNTNKTDINEIIRVLCETFSA